MFPQDTDDLHAIVKYVINQYFPELSSCYLTTEYRNVEDSLSEFRHTYPFKDNQYKGEILLIIDDSMRRLGLRAIIGAIAHDLAHIVAWKGPGNPVISDREADNIVIERGLCAYLFESKKALEELRPRFEIKGYDSKELQEIMRYSENREIR